MVVQFAFTADAKLVKDHAEDEEVTNPHHTFYCLVFNRVLVGACFDVPIATYAPFAFTKN